tara:strand:- start:1366 stop:1518 length:153 start_codon:yes stop_codon:yes gene_type:complete
LTNSKPWINHDLKGVFVDNLGEETLPNNDKVQVAIFCGNLSYENNGGPQE